MTDARSSNPYSAPESLPLNSNPSTTPEELFLDRIRKEVLRTRKWMLCTGIQLLVSGAFGITMLDLDREFVRSAIMLGVASIYGICGIMVLCCYGRVRAFMRNSDPFYIEDIVQAEARYWRFLGLIALIMLAVVIVFLSLALLSIYVVYPTQLTPANRIHLTQAHSDWRPRLHEYLGGAVIGLGGIPESIGGVADHVHLLVGLKATHCLADFLRELKKASSVWVHNEIKIPSFAWQDGYSAFTVSATSLSAVRRYIENQEEHHRKKSFREELIEMLEMAGVQYDPKYLD